MPRGKPFTKETASKSGKKSKRGAGIKTKIKEVIGSKGFDATKEQVIKNMQELLYSDDPDKRAKYTKDFADYFVPKKREHSGELNGYQDINITVNYVKPKR